jgi:hypothetical protein
MPGENRGSPASHYDTFIEVQVWDDKPLQAYFPSTH